MTLHRVALLAVIPVVLFGAGCSAAPIEQTPSPTAVPTQSRTPAATRTQPAPSSEGRPPAPTGATESGTVTRVIDGDTFAALIDGVEVEVRLLEIDSAETKDPARPLGYCGPEAEQRLAALLPPGSPVTLERDVTDVDRFGRALRYAWGRDGMANAILLGEGLAVLDAVPPDIAWVDELVLLQDSARSQELGLWGEGTCLGDQATPVPLAGTPGPGGFTVPECAVADCDCGHFDSQAHAQWFHDEHDPRDLHRLDRDGDGEACELTGPE